MRYLAFDLVLSSMLANAAWAADVYSNFRNGDTGNTFDPAFDVGNPGCFTLPSPEYDDPQIFFTQAGTIPGHTADGPYCLSMYTEGGCSSSDLKYQRNFGPVYVNNNYYYSEATCKDEKVKSLRWTLETCSGKPSGNNPFPPNPSK